MIFGKLKTVLRGLEIVEFNTYQKMALETRMETADLTYALFNIGGEVGELLSLFAKARRDGELDLLKVEQELGDILWHVAVITTDIDTSLEHIARLNLEKLASRKERNMIGGSGNNR